VPITGTYEPSPADRSREQVERYEATDGKEGGDLRGVPVIILWTRGRHSGTVRKTPLMRVEHDGRYAVVASQGGAPKHPVWYLNLAADPEVTLQDGARLLDLRARTLEGAERDEWWGHATAVWPDYDGYQARTDRQIPIVLLEPR
jgi:deazaflavin-dependent oxidoreductase (nitroreductase family)